MHIPTFNKNLYHYRTNPIDCDNLEEVRKMGKVRAIIRNIFQCKPMVPSSQHMIIELQISGFQVQKKIVSRCLESSYEFTYKQGIGWMLK